MVDKTEENPSNTAEQTMNTNEIDEMIIGWRPSRARANWRVRQLSMTPRLRQDMSEIVTLYDDLVKEAIPCCFVSCPAILHILYGRSATNPRIRRLFRSVEYILTLRD